MDDIKPVLLVSSNWVDLYQNNKKMLWSKGSIVLNNQTKFGENYEGSEGSALVTVVC